MTTAWIWMRHGTEETCGRPCFIATATGVCLTDSIPPELVHFAQLDFVRRASLHFLPVADGGVIVSSQIRGLFRVGDHVLSIGHRDVTNLSLPAVEATLSEQVALAASEGATQVGITVLRLGHATSRPGPEEPQGNAEALLQLEAMGVPRQLASRALSRTGNHGVVVALDWFLAHRDDAEQPEKTRNLSEPGDHTVVDIAGVTAGETETDVAPAPSSSLPSTRQVSSESTGSSGRQITLKMTNLALGNDTTTTATNNSNITRPPSVRDALTRGGSSVLRQLSRSLSIPDPSDTVTTAAAATFYCQICLCNDPVTEGFQLHECGHVFHAECLTNYLSTKINHDGQVHLPCPFIGIAAGQAVPPPDCFASIRNTDIDALIDAPTKIKLGRFRLNAENPHNRQCPRCNADQIGDPEHPATTCAQCGFVYCHVHANAHTGMTCQRWEAAQRKITRQTEAMIAKQSRQCPQCHMAIMKSSGCNHMTCTQCHTHFCWICGKDISGGVVEHFQQGVNLFGCPGAQMDADNTDRQSWAACGVRARIWRRRLLFFLLMLVLSPLLLAALVVVLLTLPWTRGDKHKIKTALETAAKAVGVLVISPVLVLLLVLFLLTMPIHRGDRGHLQNMAKNFAWVFVLLLAIVLFPVTIAVGLCICHRRYTRG